MSIFSTVYDNGTGFGDLRVNVDPFTGKTAIHTPVVSRYPKVPLIKREDFFDSVCKKMLRGEIDKRIDHSLETLKTTFNPGLTHFDGKYLMLVRFENAERWNHVYVAMSDDGINWDHNPVLCKLPDLPKTPDMDMAASRFGDDILQKKWRDGDMYDPRITQMDNGEYFITFAVDYDTLEEDGAPYTNICDNVLYKTKDFSKFEFVCTFAASSRNGIFFPRQIDGCWYNAGRPIRSGKAGRAYTYLYRSKDLKNWEEVETLIIGGHNWMTYAGTGFPPFETENYWVVGTHGVGEQGTHRVHYQGGLMLLDKKTMKPVARPVPLITPQELCEFTGWVDNVIFPTGILFEDGTHNGIKSPDTKAVIYFGGGDQVINAGTTTVGKLVEHALGNYNPFQVLS